MITFFSGDIPSKVTPSSPSASDATGEDLSLSVCAFIHGSAFQQALGLSGVRMPNPFVMGFNNVSIVSSVPLS